LPDGSQGGKPFDTEIARTYTMIKGAGDYVDEDAQILKRAYLDALEYLVTPHQDLDQFLTHIEEAKRVNQSSPGGKVNLMTIHQAKGLEFKCVIIPGLNEGILPHVNSLEQTILNLEEERRLMYVAMTRAMERLIITHRKRQMGQPITVASRFLKELVG
jgi:DNA helicase-2/ATP-dependent DNA helicase PcrA